jgi:hypothetical protein
MSQTKGAGMSGLQIAGLLVIANCMVVFFLLLANGKSPDWIGGIGFVALLVVGLALILNDKITKLGLKDGTIELVQQAKSDLAEIAEIKGQVQKLKDQAETQTATINLVATEASTAKKLTEELTEKSQKADEKLVQIDQTLSKALISLNTIDEYTGFHAVALAAQTGNRKAFDEIRRIADSQKPPFSGMALQVFKEIMSKNTPSMYMRPGDPPWKEGVNPKKLLIGDLKASYDAAPNLRPNILSYATSRSDFSKRDRMQFCVEVMQNEQVDLNLVSLAGRYFGDLSGDKLMPLATPQHLAWWEENKDKLPVEANQPESKQQQPAGAAAK